MRSVCDLPAGAVWAISTGRLWPSASEIRRSTSCVRSAKREAAAHPLSTTITTGPEPFSAVSGFGLSTGSARAMITSAAAAMRINVSHQGVLAGVFSRLMRSSRMRVGGKAMRRGRGGIVRSSQ
jgi:hypothetical protein